MPYYDQIPIEVTRRMSDISIAAFGYYIHLITHRYRDTGKCIVSISDSIKETGISRRTIFRSRQELACKNWAKFNSENTTLLMGFDVPEELPDSAKSAPDSEPAAVPNPHSTVPNPHSTVPNPHSTVPNPHSHIRKPESSQNLPKDSQNLTTSASLQLPPPASKRPDPEYEKFAAAH